MAGDKPRNEFTGTIQGDVICECGFVMERVSERFGPHGGYGVYQCPNTPKNCKRSGVKYWAVIMPTVLFYRVEQP